MTYQEYLAIPAGYLGPLPGWEYYDGEHNPVGARIERRRCDVCGKWKVVKLRVLRAVV